MGRCRSRTSATCAANSCKPPRRPCDRSLPPSRCLRPDRWHVVGASSGFNIAFDMLRDVADTDAPVLFQGESGVGKEMFARNLHAMGARAAMPFVAVNCAAISETLIEAELFGVERGAFTGASATRAGPLRARRAAARCSSTRSPPCRCSRAGQAAARATGGRDRARRRHAHPDRRRPARRGDQHRPARRGGRRHASAPTCSTASTSSPCASRRCATAAPTSRC